MIGKKGKSARTWPKTGMFSSHSYGSVKLIQIRNVKKNMMMRMMKANKRDQWSYWFPRLYKIFAIQNLNNFWARTFEPLSAKLKKTEHFSKRASEKVVDVIMYDHIEWSLFTKWKLLLIWILAPKTIERIIPKLSHISFFWQIL